MPAHPTVISLKKLGLRTNSTTSTSQLVAESTNLGLELLNLQWETPITETYYMYWNIATRNPSIYQLRFIIRRPFNSTSRKVNWKEFFNKPSALSLTTNGSQCALRLTETAQPIPSPSDSTSASELVFLGKEKLQPFVLVDLIAACLGRMNFISTNMFQVCFFQNTWEKDFCSQCIGCERENNLWLHRHRPLTGRKHSPPVV